MVFLKAPLSPSNTLTGRFSLVIQGAMKSDGRKGRRSRSPLDYHADDRPTPEEKIAFFIRFAQIVDPIREGDRLNVEADIQRLLGWSDKEAKQITYEEIATTKDRVLQELKRVAEANAFNAQRDRPSDRPFSSL